MFYMKRALKSKESIVINKQKTKPPIISAKTAKSIEKKTTVSAPKVKPTTKAKIIAVFLLGEIGALFTAALSRTKFFATKPALAM